MHTAAVTTVPVVAALTPTDVGSLVYPRYAATRPTRTTPKTATIPNGAGRDRSGRRSDQAKRLKQLERENARLKRIVADQSLDISILKEAAEGNF